MLINNLDIATYLKEISACRMTLARKRKICYSIMIKTLWRRVMNYKVNTNPLSLQMQNRQEELSILAMRPSKAQVDNSIPLRMALQTVE